MNDNQTNRFEMAKATLGVLDGSRPLWEAVPVMVEDRDRLAALLATVRSAARRQADPTRAATAVKDELRDDVRARTYLLASAVRSWALRQGDAGLAARVELTRTDLDGLRDAALAERSEIVVAAARDHLGGDDGLTARQGVTPDEVDALDALDDQFADALSTPRAAIVARSRATAEIAEALAAVHALLRDHLDPMVERFAADAPAFARDYAAARVVVDRGRGPAPPEDAPTA